MNVYEHGVERDKRVEGSQLRLLATTDLPLHFGFSYTILDVDGSSLHDGVMGVASIEKAHCNADYFEESDLRYCIGGILYRLDRIIDRYVWVARLFAVNHPVVTRGNTWDPVVFYEIEAFLDAARRVYETIRKVLWKHYGKTTGRWRSIEGLLLSPYNVPPMFVEKLTASMTTFGGDLKDYRDCVAHYDPLTDGGTTCWTEGYEGKWGMTVKLPENPKAQGRLNYRFENGPDALTYSHSVACHLVDLCKQLSGLTEIRCYLDHPEQGEGWKRSLQETADRAKGKQ